MRGALLVPIIILALAGCLDEPAPPTETRFATHATDCRKATNATTCQVSTGGTPLAVETRSQGNRSRVGFVLANDGTTPLAFDGEPPAFWLYVRQEGGPWSLVAFHPDGAAAGRVLAPGENLTLVLHYGRYGDSRARDVRYEAPIEAYAWPGGTYRACWSAHPGDAPEWVRGCKDFRIK